MRIETLDHINIRTVHLDDLTRWYVEVLGMELGARPEFHIPGAWLYANGQAMVHLIEADPPPDPPGGSLGLEHGAFRATGFLEMKAALEERGETFKESRFEDLGIVQIHLRDPDGNHVHVDFDIAEAG
jgi:catechol 2,3-dioxygenase-like lactoylglutathione lyase family enzyme